METPRSQFVLKLLPSFGDFAFLMPIAYLFGRMEGLKSLLSDADTGWHIRTGEWILRQGWAPTRDIFSFSKPAQPWFAWEWLSDVILAKLNAVGGLGAVCFFSILLLSATFVLLYREARRQASALVAIVLTFLAASSSSIHWLARPHLFTLFFLVLFYSFLESVRTGRRRFAGAAAFALPLLTILWTNLHGGFFVGILLIAVFGAAELLTAALSGHSEVRARAVAGARGYFLIALACAAASLVNPYTYHLHVHVAEYLRDPWAPTHIFEFFPPNFHMPTLRFFEVLLAAGTLAAWWHLRNGRYADAMLTVMWAHGGLVAARNIPIFAILAAPASAAAIQHGLNRVSEWRTADWVRSAAARFNRAALSAETMESVPRWRLASAFGLAVVALLIWAPNPPKRFRAEFDPDVYPAAALKAMQFSPSERVFTHDEWGDYLIWTLYPRGGRVFVDGRSDFYGADFEEKYMDILNVRYGWEKTLSDYRIDTVLMPATAPLTGALKESSKWTVAYDDGVSLVFRSSGRIGGEPVSAAARSAASRGREATKTFNGGSAALTRSKT